MEEGDTGKLSLSCLLILGTQSLEGRSKCLPPIQRAEIGTLKVLLTPTFCNKYTYALEKYTPLYENARNKTNSTNGGYLSFLVIYLKFFAEFFLVKLFCVWFKIWR